MGRIYYGNGGQTKPLMDGLAELQELKSVTPWSGPNPAGEGQQICQGCLTHGERFGVCLKEN